MRSRGGHEEESNDHDRDPVFHRGPLKRKARWIVTRRGPVSLLDRNPTGASEPVGPDGDAIKVMFRILILCRQQ